MKRKIAGLLLSSLLVLFLFGCSSKDSGVTGNATKATVYINMTDHRYHRQECSEAGPNPISTKLSDAKKNGYRPCNKCDPPG